MKIKDRVYNLLCKLISLKILVGIPILVTLLVTKNIDGMWFTIGLLALLGLREVSKALVSRK